MLDRRTEVFILNLLHSLEAHVFLAVRVEAIGSPIEGALKPRVSELEVAVV